MQLHLIIYLICFYIHVDT